MVGNADGAQKGKRHSGREDRVCRDTCIHSMGMWKCCICSLVGGRRRIFHRVSQLWKKQDLLIPWADGLHSHSLRDTLKVFLLKSFDASLWFARKLKSKTRQQPCISAFIFQPEVLARL